MLVDILSTARSTKSLTVIMALVVVLMGRKTHAAELPVYDLDSLVYQSDEIVEGIVVDGWDDAVELRIDRVHAGALVPNTTIRVSIREYAKASVSTWLTHFDAGDHLLVFLSKGQLVPSGLVLVLRGRCYQAFQWSNPGGYISSPIFDPESKTATLSQYRTAIQISLENVTVVRRRFSRPPSRSDIPWLLALIAERLQSYKPTFGGFGDAILWDADERLRVIGDFPALEAAVAMGAGDAWGFDSPPGREYLLRRIGDAAVPIQTRLKLADILQWSGGNLATEDAAAPEGPLTQPARGMTPQVGWLTRLARLISALPQQDGELKARLAEQLCSQVESAIHDNGSAIPADAQAAAQVLAANYARETTDAVRCQIEMILLKVGTSGYEQLRSPCGPIISWAEPQTQDYSSIDGSRLHVTVKALTSGTSRVTSAQLVLRPLGGGGKSYLLPSGIVGQNMSTSPGYSWTENDSFALPVGFIPGRYHLFFEFLNGSQVISVGHGSEVDLPIAVDSSRPVAPSRLRQLLAKWNERWTLRLIAGLSLASVLLLVRSAIRSRRRLVRFRAGLCTRCGYDLRASPNRCPECGASNPTRYRTGGMRRRILKTAGAALFVALLGMIVVWTRSYRIGECLTRTSDYRADSIYSTNGRIEIVVETDPAIQGWSYDQMAPADLPHQASEFVAFTIWRAVGVEMVPTIGWTSISDWLITLLLGVSALTLLWIARFQGRVVDSPIFAKTS